MKKTGIFKTDIKKTVLKQLVKNSFKTNILKTPQPSIQAAWKAQSLRAVGVAISPLQRANKTFQAAWNCTNYVIAKFA